MIDEQYTESQVKLLVGVAKGEAEANESIEQYMTIHSQVTDLRSRLSGLHHSEDPCISQVLRDLDKFLSSTEEGAFRTLLFQAEGRQDRAFSEMRRRLSSLQTLIQGLA